MSKSEIDLVVSQIRNIILGRPITDEIRCKSEEFQELQEGLDYLKESCFETQDYLLELSNGNLDAKIPNKKNMINANLKELQASLKHLSWQTTQIAMGDYNQRVSFLGEFSDSFNTMVQQLRDRENQLKKQSKMLYDSVEMFESVMDGLSAWILVLDSNSKELVFINEAARPVLNVTVAKSKFKNLYKYIKDYEYEGFKSDFICREEGYVFHVQTYFIRWNNRFANVHYIVDITKQNEQDEYMKNIAFRDGLTNLYNRRYIVEYMQIWIDKKETVAFCLLDLDGLKYANDMFGHKAGDNYLLAVSSALEAEFYDEHILARVGGDEFAVLSNISEEELYKRIDRVRNKIVESSVDYPMSFSFGIVYVDSSMAENYDCNSVMVEADEKMYAYKKAFKIERG